MTLRDDLKWTMVNLHDAQEYLQRAYDFLFDEGKETDIEVDFREAGDHCEIARKLIEEFKRKLEECEDAAVETIHAGTSTRGRMSVRDGL